MIIDRDNYVNVDNTTLVKKLNLSTVRHHKPYNLQCLNECGEVKVTKQVLICFFFVGRYINEWKSMCRGVPMVSRTSSLPLEWCVKRGFGYHHKIMILRFMSHHLVLWLLKPMLYESPGKGLVMQRKNTSPPVHHTYKPRCKFSVKLKKCFKSDKENKMNDV